MAVVRAAVLLTAYQSAAPALNIPLEPPWFVQYFFNPEYGHKAFWLKQTDNEVVLDGEVTPWAFYPPGSLELVSCTKTAQTAVNAMRQDRGVDFSRFDFVIVFLGLHKTVGSDGGSTEVNVDGRRMRAVVTRIGDRFDFIAHEIGHALGLAHSFGSVLFQTLGERPGGYGHPHCVMSAMSYGFLRGGAFNPASPRDGRPEYSFLAPSLCAVPALNRGWINAHSYVVADGVVKELDIRSRHAGGRDATLVPQALRLTVPNGDT